MVAIGLGLQLAPQARAEMGDRVCLEQPMQALSAFLSNYEDAGAALAGRRSIDFTPFRFMGDNQAREFRDEIVEVLDVLPGHLVLIYHLDPEMMCLFAWEAHRPNEMIYLRRHADIENLKSDAGEIATLFGARVPRGAARSADRGGRAIMRVSAGGSAEERLARIAAVMAPDPSLSAAIAHAEALILYVPGHLAALPFLAMPLGSAAPLVETHSVTILSGLNDLIDPHERWSTAPREWNNILGPSVVVVADPATPPEGIGGAVFSALPGAAREAAQIAERKGGRLIAGADATRAELLSAMRDAEVFHYAGHAVADATWPLEQSFLALADGALDARSIQQNALWNAPLIILSACDTGRGEALGAGIVGLARGFQIAGASGTVLSHWPVSDLSAEHLMLAFHDELEQAPPAEALRRAALLVRRTYPDPVDWAAFSYLGVPFVEPIQDDDTSP